jgi:DNA-binding CsgD family transcriptional regulator
MRENGAARLSLMWEGACGPPPRLSTAPPRHHDRASTDPALLARITPRRVSARTMIVAHHTNAGIAAHLGVAPATVKRTIARLRTLTRCRSKRELVRWRQVHEPAWRAARALVAGEVTKL